ncbi:MAG: hypothetical protein NUV31_08185, partial [Dehalococcoidales bacterium]|nr:hypothetical protein [Dehalococcoidales bacterium]
MKLHIYYLHSSRTNPSLSNRNYAKNLDKYLAALIAVISFILTVWLFITIHRYIEVGITLFISSTAYLLIRQKSSSLEISSVRNLVRNNSIYIVLN